MLNSNDGDLDIFQCVEHMIEFKMHENGETDGDSGTHYYKVNARDFFVPTEVRWAPSYHS